MSVTVTARTLWRPAPNLTNDPTLPVRIWYAQAAVTGDAGGGFGEVRIILNPGGSSRSGRAWSIETSIPRRSSASSGAENAVVNTENLDVIGPGLNNPIQKSFVQGMVPASTTLQAPEVGQLVSEMHPKLFLGAQGASENDAVVRIQVANPGVSDILGWYAEGYEWGPGALNWGYRRPVDGLFGT